MRFDAHTVVLLLLSPAAPDHSPEEALALQDAHLAFIADRIEAGEMLAAGPVTDAVDPPIRGIAVWALPPDRARAAAAADPAVRAGRFLLQVVTWMTPAGQLEYVSVPTPHSSAEARG
mgnify:CR=1 FL=1